jgi:hypothetical protein
MGAEHILSGADHILFILGLLCLGGTLRSLLYTVTAFTLAHSVTLTIAATGIFVPSPKFIEPAIALSIVAVAVDNIRILTSNWSAASTSAGASNKDDLRPYFALGFGLIHGFGFAGALAEAGLARENLGIALASFNIGVEIGQAAIILVVAPLLAYLAMKRPHLFKRVVLVTSIVIALIGGFWFIARLVSL